MPKKRYTGGTVTVNPNPKVYQAGRRRDPSPNKASFEVSFRSGSSWEAKARDSIVTAAKAGGEREAEREREKFLKEYGY